MMAGTKSAPLRISAALLLLPLGLLLGGRLGLSLMPPGTFWGLDTLDYFPSSSRILFTILPLLPFFIAASAWDDFSRHARAAGALFFVAGAMIIAVAILNPIETFFYGDGPLLPSQIFLLTSGHREAASQLLNMQSAPLMGAALVGAALASARTADQIHISSLLSVLTPFRLLSILGFALLLPVLRDPKRPMKSLATLMTIAGTASVIFFFGYVEYYLFVTCAIAAYAIFAERFLRGDKEYFWKALVAFTLALFSHYYTIILLPSLFYLLCRRNGWIPRVVTSVKSITLSPLAAIVLYLGGYFLLGYDRADSRIFMPIAPAVAPAGVQSYTLLSSIHLQDLVNLAFLHAPLGILCVAALLLVDGKKYTTSPVFHFYFLAVSFFSIFLFFGNTALGLARDWDLLAPWGVLVSLCALAMLWNSRAPAAAMRFGLASLLLAVPWIGLNLDSPRTASRFAHILSLYDGRLYGDYSLSGYEALRKYYDHAGDRRKCVDISMKMVELLDYPSNYRLLLNAAIPFAKTDPAEYRRIVNWMGEHLGAKYQSFLERDLERDYSITRAQLDSVIEAVAYSSYLNTGGEELSTSLAAIPAGTGQARRFSSIEGTEAYLRQDFQTAIEDFEKCLSAKFEAPKLFWLRGRAYLETGDSARGIAVFRKGIEIFPEDPELLYLIGLTYIERKMQLEEASELLRNARQLHPSPEILQGIDALLEKLQRR